MPLQERLPLPSWWMEVLVLLRGRPRDGFIPSPSSLLTHPILIFGMELRSHYRDISPDEESRLPLPPEWIRAFKVSGKGPVKVYRHSRTGQEMHEHPILLQALTMTKRRPLPFGWSVIDTPTRSGEVQRSYFNADMNLTTSDHPTLRDCVIECLLGLGLDLDYIALVMSSPSPPLPPEPPHQPDHVEPAAPSTALDAEPVPLQTSLSPLQKHQLHALQQQYQQQSPSPPPQQRPSTNSYFSEPSAAPSGLRLADLGFGEYVEPADSEYPLPDDPPPDEADGAEPSPAIAADRWETILKQRRNDSQDYNPHKPSDFPQLPISTSSLKVLRHDIDGSIRRVHRQLARLRALLAGRAGYDCSLTTIVEENVEDDNDRVLITLASDIVTELKQQPQHITAAMASSHKLGGAAMLQIAFVSLHRLLHPFSTDNSLTTALLLESINFQLAELSAIEEMVPPEDSKKIVARALFISDPTLALSWNPREEALPVVPCVADETVLTCLLRCYAIRRDVTCYFRAIWMPVLPAISTLLGTFADLSDPLLLSNLLTVAHRLLECTFSDKAMTVFPPIATAVTRAINEIGGQDAMLFMLFNLIIMPNLVKIVGGDHDSVENEDVHRVDAARSIVNKYFDCKLWLQRPKREDLDAEALRSLDVLTSLLWVVWRLFTVAAFMTESEVDCLTVPAFLQSRLNHFNVSGVKERKLQNLVTRVKRRIAHGCAWLVRMPLDLQGSEYLGLNENQNFFGLPSSPETTELLDMRISSLAFKPGEMLNLTMASKQELLGLFADVGMAMDDRQYSSDTPLYQAISTFLSLFPEDQNDNENKEELMELVFLYASESMDSHEDDSGVDKEIIARTYWQLLRGVKLCCRYEDTLINLVRKVENQEVSNVHELVEDNGWYFEPEFDLDFKISHVDIAEKHTAGSKGKIRNPKFGLQQASTASVFPLFSQYSHSDNQHRSLRELQDDAIASYRFGSANRGVDAGTSLGRQRVLKPKLGPKEMKVTTLKEDKVRSNYARSETSSGSTYTRSNLKPSSTFLATTESFRNMKAPNRATNKQYDESFMRSMRGHAIIPTEEFQSRYHRRKKAWYFHANDQLRLQGSTSAPGHRESKGEEEHPSRSPPKPLRKRAPGDSVQAIASPVAMPFPEHLRHRIRRDSGDPEILPPAAEEVVAETKTSWKNDSAYVKALIAEYHANVLKVVPPSSPGELDSVSVGSKARARSRSPSMPRAFETTNNLLSPTKSVSKKMTTQDPVSRQFLRDLGEGKPPELRSYEPNELVAHHNEPFVLTRAKQYPPTGLRVPRVPHHLLPPDDMEDDDNASKGSSSAASRSTGGRSRGRSPSPAAPAARRGSYLSPTAASSNGQWPAVIDQQRQQERKAEEARPVEVEDRRSPPLSENAAAGVHDTPSTPFASPQSTFRPRPVPMPLSLHKTELFAKAVASVSKDADTAQVPEAASAATAYRRRSSTRPAHMVPVAPVVAPPPAPTAGVDNVQPSLAKQSSSYSMKFSVADDHTAVNLDGDRQQAAAMRKKKMAVEEPLEDDNDGEQRLLKNEAAFKTKVAPKKDDVPPRAAGPSVIPLVKRKSLLAEGQDMKALLAKDGVLAIKHGRTGQPKKKLIRFDAASQSIIWCAPERTGLGGLLFGSPQQKAPSGIPLDAICEVCKGVKTEVLTRAGLVDPNCCMSIVTADRTLDLTLPSAVDRDNVIRGLRAILTDASHPVRFI